MTEKSAPWGGTATGDATLAPYSDQQWCDIWDDLFNDNRSIGGIIRGKLNDFACTSVATPISIGTGGAMVDGSWYISDAATSIAIASPVGNPRIDRIVIRKNFAAQTVRITRIAGVAASPPAAPAIVQIDGTTWDIPLYQVWINPAGTIIVTPEFNYLSTPMLGRAWRNGGRLTLLYDTYCRLDDVSSYIATSTDTVAETITFSVETPFKTGQAVQVAATASGLTAGTTYFVNTADQLTYSFHTNFYDAQLGTNKVNLTGNVTTTIWSAKLYLLPYLDDTIDVYDATTYKNSCYKIPSGTALAFSMNIIPLANPAANAIHDVFITTAGLTSTTWTSASARATAIEKVNGCYRAIGDSSKRYLGSMAVHNGDFSPVETDLKRGLYNYYNRAMRKLCYKEATNSWTYDTTTWRPWNNSSTARVWFVIGVAEDCMNARVSLSLYCGAGYSYCSIGINSIAAPDCEIMTHTNSTTRVPISAHYKRVPPAGLNYLTPLEYDTISNTKYGDNGGTIIQSALVGYFMG